MPTILPGGSLLVVFRREGDLTVSETECELNADRRSGLCRRAAVTIVRDEVWRRKMLRRDFLALTGAGLRATAFVPIFHAK